MIPVLKVVLDKDHPGVYIARTLIQGQKIDTPTAYEDIRSAIGGEARRADGLALFVKLEYCEMSTGTVGVQHAQVNASVLASRLVSDCRAVYDILGIDGGFEP